MQKIKCINNFEAETSLTLNKEYDLQGIYGITGEKLILIDDTGISHVWYSWRFEALKG
jgi:hypothetical protein